MSAKLVLALSMSVLWLGACAANPTPSTPANAPMMGGGGMMGGNGMMGGGMMGNGNMEQHHALMHGGVIPSGVPTAVPTPLNAPPVAVSQVITLTLINLQFAPQQVTVPAGATIQWVLVNQDNVLHNFLSPEAAIPYLNIPPGTTQTLVWTAPLTPGTYSALCTLHPNMTVTIEVAE